MPAFAIQQVPGKQLVLFDQYRGQGPNVYRRDSQEHDHKLILTQDRVADECVGEACQTPPSFFNEQIVRSYVFAVDCIFVSSATSQHSSMKSYWQHAWVVKEEAV